MSTPEQVVRQARALARVRAARIEKDRTTQQADEANEQFRQAVLAALETNAAVQDIAVAGQISRQRVFQISRGE